MAFVATLIPRVAASASRTKVASKAGLNQQDIEQLATRAVNIDKRKGADTMFLIAKLAAVIVLVLMVMLYMRESFSVSSPFNFVHKTGRMCKEIKLAR